MNNKWYVLVLLLVLIVMVGLFVIFCDHVKSPDEEVVDKPPQTESVKQSNDLKDEPVERELSAKLPINPEEVVEVDKRWAPDVSPVVTKAPSVEPKPVTPSTPTPTTAPAVQPTENPKPVDNNTQTSSLFTESDIVMIAKLLGVECPDVKSKTEQACVVWCVLNRVDAGLTSSTISGVITAPYQFAYRNGTCVRQDLYDLALDVLNRWAREKNGEVDVGRVLPRNYMWFKGDCVAHNYFRDQYRGGNIWDYSLPSPYDT